MVAVVVKSKIPSGDIHLGKLQDTAVAHGNRKPLYSKWTKSWRAPPEQLPEVAADELPLGEGLEGPDAPPLAVGGEYLHNGVTRKRMKPIRSRTGKLVRGVDA